ncbi:antibiotic biosynthesis monooxygenase [Mycobacterium sp. DL592]|uniref:antibiotic biosynthesis monooxygenase family protein n=1 Tax=Mycobacterium sp. DL592 TaxID=2675524 RepID=UPI001423C4AA|nr:antibiotic biosynthesis monooxygenase family protein [Mycobacterium sp. DL592]
MTATTDPDGRTASTPVAPHAGPVTLINSFVVTADRDGPFEEIWQRTSSYFRAQPGFIGLRLHRALSGDATYRYVNVAVWNSAAEYLAAHTTAECRALFADPALREFASSPALYEVIAEHDAF